MATKRLFQLLAKVETEPGVVASNLVDVANAKILVSDPQITFDRETYEREINRTSLTPLTPLAGVVEAEATFRVEMTGTTTAGAAPDWGILLQACGFKQREFGIATIGAVTTVDAFHSGETVTGTSGTDLEVVHDTWDGSTKLLLVDKQSTGLGNNPITGDTSTATATVSNWEAQQGWAWTPSTRPVVTITGSLASGVTLAAGDIVIGETSGVVLQSIGAWTGGGTNDFYLLDPGDFLVGSETFNDTSGVPQFDLGSSGFSTMSEIPSVSLAVIEDGVIRTLKGCRGSVSFSANIGEPVFMDFTFRGLISSIADGQLSGTPSPTSQVPPTFLEISYGVAKDSPKVAPADEHTACITSLGIEFTNEVAIERCAASTDGTRGAAFLSGRSVTGSIDPSVRPEASFPFLDAFRNGDTFRQRVTVGDAAANQFHISVPASLITSEGGGDRNGLATREIQFSASGKNPAGNDANDREVVITYHQGQTYVR